MAEKKNVTCPNCNGSATREGDVITCQACDVEFTIYAKNRKQVKTVGRLDGIEKRVEQLEVQVGKPELEKDPQGEPEKDIHDEPEKDIHDETEEPILPE